MRCSTRPAAYQLGGERKRGDADADGDAAWATKFQKATTSCSSRAGTR